MNGAQLTEGRGTAEARSSQRDAEGWGGGAGEPRMDTNQHELGYGVLGGGEEQPVRLFPSRTAVPLHWLDHVTSS